MNGKLKKSYFSDTKSGFNKSRALLLKGGWVIDIAKKEQTKLDLIIKNGKIRELGKNLSGSFEGNVIDIEDKVIVPGFLDMHVHFREPGREDEETLMTGAASAMAGGFTGVCTMPNTDPVTDNREIVEFIKDKFEDHLVDAYPIAAITLEQKGEKLVEIADLVDAGAVAFSDDGKSVMNSQVMRRALEYAKMFDVPIIEHCEDAALAKGGVMNEGFMSSRLGLPGIPVISEQIVVARNVKLVDYTEGKMHLAHISTAGSVEIIRRAKEQGIKVTCEATPHHFTLTDKAVEFYDTNTKMNPPLCTQKDIDAIVAGLKDGSIDAIATDHAPHSVEEKELEYIDAPFGIIGLETAIGLMITELIEKHNFSVYEVLEKVAVNPYKILGLEVPHIAENRLANLTIIDLNEPWSVDKNKFKSRSRNTPFDGFQLTGKSYGVMNNSYFMLNSESEKNA
ncbi:amidohydrolase family protein [candidate division KSB1 bacterium]|nr:amidohydrolase family protein [candidate division KSB1 bacterium]